MDNNKVNVVNGMVTGVFLGTPMQDATPDKAEDNDVYATERNTQTRVGNSVNSWNNQPKRNGGASSWNDLTDKPFGKEIKETVLYENNEFVSVYDESGSQQIFSRTDALIGLEEGKTYTVEYDGEQYECTGEAFSLGIGIGNPRMYNAGSLASVDNGWPFGVWDGRGSTSDSSSASKIYGLYARFPKDDKDNHTIKITCMGEVVTTIDPVYLPDSVKGGSGGGALIVNLTTEGGGGSAGSNVHPYYGATLDKTYDEIKSAIDAGIPVEIRFKEGSGSPCVMHLAKIDGGYYYFSSVHAEYDFRGYTFTSTVNVYCAIVDRSSVNFALIAIS